MNGKATSDVHFCTWPTFSTVGPNGINSRLDQTGVQVQKIIAGPGGSSGLFVAGDLFHTKKVDGEVIDVAHRAFRGKGGLPVYGVPGNHDMVSFEHQHHAARALSDQIDWLDDLNGRIRRPTGGWKVYGIPYVSKRDRLAQEIAEARRHNPTLVVMHAGFAGANMGSDYIADVGDCIDPNLLDGVADLVISGHFHQPQVIDLAARKVYEPKGPVRIPYTAGKTILIPGAPEQHNFGDEGSIRGYWVFDTDEHYLEFRPLEGPKFLTVDAMTDFDPKILVGNYVRMINVRPSRELETGLQKSGALGVRIEEAVDATKIERDFNLSPSQAPEKVIEEYVRHATTTLDHERLIRIGREALGRKA